MGSRIWAPIRKAGSRAKKSRTLTKEQTSLLDLPTELLLVILEDLGPAELYSLALLSRRLHYLALPIYFSRHRLGDVLKSSSVDVELWGGRLNCLRGLRMSLFITSLNHLAYGFNYVGNELVTEIKELHCLLLKLTHVNKVTLNLQNPDHFLQKPHTGRPDAVRLCLPAFAGLLNTVVERSCRSLTVHHGRLFTEVFQYDETLRYQAMIMQETLPQFTHSFIAIKGKLKMPSKKISPIQQETYIQASDFSQPRTPSQLETFVVESSMLLHPPFDKWTVRLLNTSPLTSLTFESMHLSRENWAALLPRLNLRSLSYLSIDTSSIAFSDLSAFFVRHPNITSLKLSGLPITSSWQYLPADALPRLHTLNATPGVIVSFLGPEGARPALRSLCILCYTSAQRRFETSAIDGLLSSVAHRVKETVLSMKIIVNPIGSGPMMGLSEDEDEDREGDGVEHLLDHLTSLELDGGRFHLLNDSGARISRWLAMFPALQHLSLLGICPKDAAVFVRSISDTCPGILDVSLHRELRTVTDWLAGGG